MDLGSLWRRITGRPSPGGDRAPSNENVPIDGAEYRSNRGKEIHDASLPPGQRIDDWQAPLDDR